MQAIPGDPRMKLLVIGAGGREHALAWKLAQSSRVDEVLVAPGNAGTATEGKCRNADVAATDIDGLLALARDEGVALTVVGPEGPLVAGIVDRFRAEGLRIFGPTAAAAQLEGSKAFAKDFLARHGIPTAHYARSEEHTSELQSLMRISYAVFCLKKKIHILSKYPTIYLNLHTHSSTAL